MSGCQPLLSWCNRRALGWQVTLPLGGSNVVAELGAHEVSKPGEKTFIDLDMTRAVIIDAVTENVI